MRDGGRNRQHHACGMTRQKTFNNLDMTRSGHSQATRSHMPRSPSTAHQNSARRIPGQALPLCAHATKTASAGALKDPGYTMRIHTPHQDDRPKRRAAVTSSPPINPAISMSPRASFAQAGVLRCTSTRDHQPHTKTPDAAAAEREREPGTIPGAGDRNVMVCRLGSTSTLYVTASVTQG